MTAVFKEWAVYVDSEMSPEERAAVAKAADQAVLKKYAAGTKGKKGQCLVGSSTLPFLTSKCCTRRQERQRARLVH